jgi:hypothetical protein
MPESTGINLTGTRALADITSSSKPPVCMRLDARVAYRFDFVS